MAASPNPSGPPGLRRATAADLPAIKAIIDAAYARYLTRMDKRPAPMFRDYGPSVEDGTTWVAASPSRPCSPCIPARITCSSRTSPYIPTPRAVGSAAP